MSATNEPAIDLGEAGIGEQLDKLETCSIDEVAAQTGNSFRSGAGALVSLHDTCRSAGKQTCLIATHGSEAGCGFWTSWLEAGNTRESIVHGRGISRALRAGEGGHAGIDADPSRGVAASSILDSIPVF